MAYSKFTNLSYLEVVIPAEAGIQRACNYRKRPVCISVLYTIHRPCYILPTCTITIIGGIGRLDSHSPIGVEDKFHGNDIKVSFQTFYEGIKGYPQKSRILESGVPHGS